MKEHTLRNGKEKCEEGRNVWRLHFGWFYRLESQGKTSLLGDLLQFDNSD